jgi:NAD(P)-dependent dehydrogenase (short-subunit alcohol dehydrogenase family)
MISLAGKSALITGGSRGIGLAIAARLANEGVSCFLVARNADTLKAACSQLPQKGATLPPSQSLSSSAAAIPGRPHAFFASEAGDPGTWDAIGRQLAADGNEVDVLVNAAGVSQNSLLARTNPSDIAAILDTNLRAAVLASRLVGKQMMRRAVNVRRGCSIINVSSVMAFRGGTGASVYAASKAGLLGEIQPPPPLAVVMEAHTGGPAGGYRDWPQLTNTSQASRPPCPKSLAGSKSGSTHLCQVTFRPR